MRRSLESTRPILNSMDAKNRASVRMSSYSKTPTEGSFNSFSTNGDPGMQDLKTYSTQLERLNSKQLQEQRYVVSSQKSEDMSKLALGAKVQRALDRRFSNQDAVFRPKNMSEKPASTKQG